MKDRPVTSLPFRSDSVLVSPILSSTCNPARNSQFCVIVSILSLNFHVNFPVCHISVVYCFTLLWPHVSFVLCRLSFFGIPFFVFSLSSICYFSSFHFSAPTYELHTLIFYSTLPTSHFNQSCIWFSLLCLFLILHSNIYIFSDIVCVLHFLPHLSYSLAMVFSLLCLSHSSLLTSIFFCLYVFAIFTSSFKFSPLHYNLSLFFFPPFFPTLCFVLSSTLFLSLSFPVCPSFPGAAWGAQREHWSMVCPFTPSPQETASTTPSTATGEHSSLLLTAKWGGSGHSPTTRRQVRVHRYEWN